MLAAAAQRDSQLRGLAEERREADEASARHHAAAMHSMQQAHELEQVSTPLPACCGQLLSNSWVFGGRVYWWTGVFSSLTPGLPRSISEQHCTAVQEDALHQPFGSKEGMGLQGRLAQDLRLEAEAARHTLELQLAELQQRLRLSEEACAAAREDAGRLKQEQCEDACMMEVQPCCSISALLSSPPLPSMRSADMPQCTAAPASFC